MPKYIFNGEEISEDFVNQAFQASGLSTLQEYIESKQGLEVLPDENFQQDGVAGADALSGIAAPESTELSSDLGSSAFTEGDPFGLQAQQDVLDTDITGEKIQSSAPVSLTEKTVDDDFNLNKLLPKEKLNSTDNETDFVRLTKNALNSKGFNIRQAGVGTDEVLITAPNDKELRLNLQNPSIRSRMFMTNTAINQVNQIGARDEFQTFGEPFKKYDAFSEIEEFMKNNSQGDISKTNLVKKHGINYKDLELNYDFEGDKSRKVRGRNLDGTTNRGSFSANQVNNFSDILTYTTEKFFKEKSLEKFGIDLGSDFKGFSLAEFYSRKVKDQDMDLPSEVQTAIIDYATDHVLKNKNLFLNNENVAKNDLRNVIAKLGNQNFIDSSIEAIANLDEQNQKEERQAISISNQDVEDFINGNYYNLNENEISINNANISRDKIIEQIEAIDVFLENNDVNSEISIAKQEEKNSLIQKRNALIKDLNSQKETIEELTTKTTYVPVPYGVGTAMTFSSTQASLTDDFGNLIKEKEKNITASIKKTAGNQPISFRKALRLELEDGIKALKQLSLEGKNTIVGKPDFSDTLLQNNRYGGLNDSGSAYAKALIKESDLTLDDIYKINSTSALGFSEEVKSKLNAYSSAHLDLRLKLEALKNLYVLNKSPENFEKNRLADFSFEAVAATKILGSRDEAMLAVGTSRNSKDIINNFRNNYNIINKEEIESNEVPLMEFNEKSEEALKRTLVDEIVEGTGSFVPLAVEFGVLTVGTQGAATVLGAGNYIKRIAQSKRFYDRAKYLTIMSGIEEFKTQAVGFRTGAGATFATVGGLTPSFKIKGKYSFFNNILNKVFKGAGVGTIAGEASGITETFIESLNSDVDFNTFIENTYTNATDKEIGRRLAASAGTFAILGTTHLRAPDVSWSKYQQQTKENFAFYHANALRINNFEKELAGQTVEAPPELRFKPELTTEQKQEVLQTAKDIQVDLGNFLDARTHEVRLDSNNPNFEANAASHINKVFSGLSVENKPTINFVETSEQLPGGKANETAKFDKIKNTLYFVKNKFNGGRFAHELTHFGLAAYFHKNPNELRRFNDKLISSLDAAFTKAYGKDYIENTTLKEAIKKVYGVDGKPLDLTKILDRNIQIEEMITRIGQVSVDSNVGKSFDVGFVKSVVSDIANFAERKGIVKPRIKTVQDFFDFTGRFANNINQGKDVSKQIERFGEISLLDGSGENRKLVEGFTQSEIDLQTKINNLIPENLKTQEDYFKRDVFNPIYNDGNLHPLIQRYVRSRSSSKEQGDLNVRNLADRLLNFNPEAERKDGSGKVGAKGFVEFVNANTNFAKMDSNLELFKRGEIQELEGTSLDSKQIREIIDITNEGVSNEKAVNRALIDPTKFTGVDKNISVKSQITKDLSMKEVSSKHANEVAEQIWGADLAGKIMKGKYLDSSKSAVEIQQFLIKGNNLTNLIRIMPEFNVAPTSVEVSGKTLSVSDFVAGTAVIPRMSTVLRDYFYEPFVNAKGTRGFNPKLIQTSPTGRSQGKTSQTAVYRLKPKFRGPSSAPIAIEAINQLKADLGITPKGEPRGLPLGDKQSTMGQLLKNTAKIYTQLTTNKLVRNSLERLEIPIEQTIADVAAGKRSLMADIALETKETISKNSIRSISKIIGGSNKQVKSTFDKVLKLHAIEGQNLDTVLKDIKDEKLKTVLKQYFDQELWRNGVFQDAELIKNKGIRFEAFVDKVQKSAGIEGITVIGDGKGGFSNQGAGDLTIKFDFKNRDPISVNLELKLNSKANMSSSTIKEVDGKVVFTQKAFTETLDSTYKPTSEKPTRTIAEAITEKINSEEHQKAIKEFNEEGLRYANELGLSGEKNYIDSKTGMFVGQEVVTTHLTEKKFQEKLNINIEGLDAKIIEALYNSKGVYYIDTNKDGAFFMGDNIFNFDVKRLEGVASISARYVKSRIYKQVKGEQIKTDVIRFAHRAFPKLKSVTSEKSKLSFTNPRTIKESFASMKQSLIDGFAEKQLQTASSKEIIKELEKVDVSSMRDVVAGRLFSEQFKNKPSRLQNFENLDLKQQQAVLKEMAKSDLTTSKFNNKLLPESERLTGDFTNEQVLEKIQELDIANDNNFTFASKELNTGINDMIERSRGIASTRVVSQTEAIMEGKSKGRFDIFIRPQAEDFVGLLYKMLGKGKQGDADMAFFKRTLLDPYIKGLNNISADRISLLSDYKAIVSNLKVPSEKGVRGIFKKSPLKKQVGDTGFTTEQAVRAYVWTKQGMKIPGLSESQLKKLLLHVKDNKRLITFGNQLIRINKGDGYAKPGENWLSGTIGTDILEGLNTTKRSKYLEAWQKNADVMFSPENLNKLQAAYGKPYADAMKNILRRMKTGRNRIGTGDKITEQFTDFIAQATGSIMFLNSRSAVLQTLSSLNFINFGDNNIFAAGKAFANQPQYWRDFTKLFNSDFLKDRRAGLRINVIERDISTAAGKGGVRGVTARLLQSGFTPTQIADSFAIAAGGSTFYRNRIKTYEKETDADGNKIYTKEQAEQKAFLDFRETARVSQQSSSPDLISQEQASGLGRHVLAFANTPAQYARIIKKSALDLKNGRGDAKTNISKIVYYTFAQNVIFNTLQQAIFATAFDDDLSVTEDKTINLANGMANSILRGMGVYPSVFAAFKDVGIKLYTESKKKRPEYEKAGVQILNIAPPAGSKYKKIVGGLTNFSYTTPEAILEKGISLDNPGIRGAARVVEGVTNLPTDRTLLLMDQIQGAMDQDLEYWQRTFIGAGWQDWQLGIKDEEQQQESTGGFREVKRREVKRREVKRR